MTNRTKNQSQPAPYNLPKPSTMAFRAKEFLSAQGVDLKLHQTQALLAYMANFDSFEGMVNKVPAWTDKETEVATPLVSCPNPDMESEDWTISESMSRIYLDWDAFTVKLMRTSNGLEASVMARADASNNPMKRIKLKREEALARAAQDPTSDRALVAIAKTFDVEISEDNDQPGYFTWRPKHGEGCEMSLPSVAEAFADAIPAMQDIAETKTPY